MDFFQYWSLGKYTTAVEVLLLDDDAGVEYTGIRIVGVAIVEFRAIGVGIGIGINGVECQDNGSSPYTSSRV